MMQPKIQRVFRVIVKKTAAGVEYAEVEQKMDPTPLLAMDLAARAAAKTVYKEVVVGENRTAWINFDMDLMYFTSPKAFELFSASHENTLLQQNLQVASGLKEIRNKIRYIAIAGVWAPEHLQGLQDYSALLQISLHNLLFHYGVAEFDATHTLERMGSLLGVVNQLMANNPVLPMVIWLNSLAKNMRAKILEDEKHTATHATKPLIE